jgi:hypothetical protein
MRRRLRQQLRVREALLLDLGALVFELQRRGRRAPELLQAKAAELTGVDREVRALAEALDADEGIFGLVAPGIAGSCASCGAIVAADARYCSACGVPTGPALAARHEPSAELPPSLETAPDGAGAPRLEEPGSGEEPSADERAALGAGERAETTRPSPADTAPEQVTGGGLRRWLAGRRSGSR